jgi:uncharacterized protein (DUF983 family)
MLKAEILCDNPKCGNAGRYLSVDGETLCSLCSMGKTAVRVADLPAFIALTVAFLETGNPVAAEELRRYLPRRP